MRKMRIFGILAIAAMVLSSCQPQGATGPIIIGQQASTITPSQAAARLNAAQLVNDIIEEADGIAVTEVEAITSQSAVIGSASIAMAAEETETTPETPAITGYRLTVSFSGYDNGDCVITGGSLTIDLTGTNGTDSFSVTGFSISKDKSNSLTVSSNRVYDYSMSISSLEGTIKATIVVEGTDSLSFSAGIVTAAPSGITGSVEINGTTVDKSETTSSVESDSDWYTTVEEGESKAYSINTLEELIRFGEIVSSGLDDFDGDTVNLAAGTYDFEGIEGFSVGKGTRDDSKNTNDSNYVFNTEANSFKGTFDGNNAVIRNWTFNAGNGYGSEDKNAYGFFAVIDEAEVKDLIFEDCHVTCGSSTGGIAVGFAKDSAISGIEVRDSSVVAFQGAGAIAGRLYSYNSTGKSSIKDCKVSGTAVITNGEYYDPTAGTATEEPPYNAGGIVGCVSGRAASNGANTVSGNTVDLRGENAYVKAAGEHAGGIAGTAAWTVFSGNTVILDAEDAVGDIIAEGATLDGENTGSKDVALIHQYVSSSDSVEIGQDNHYRVGETETDINDTNNFIERDTTEDGNS